MEFAGTGREGIQRAHRTFEDFLREHQIPIDTGAGGSGPWGTFRAEAPPGDEFIGQHARLFDLTIVGQPSRGATPPRTYRLATPSRAANPSTSASMSRGVSASPIESAGLTIARRFGRGDVDGRIQAHIVTIES